MKVIPGAKNVLVKCGGWIKNGIEKQESEMRPDTRLGFYAVT